MSSRRSLMPVIDSLSALFHMGPSLLKTLSVLLHMSPSLVKALSALLHMGPSSVKAHGLELYLPLFWVKPTALNFTYHFFFPGTLGPTIVGPKFYFILFYLFFLLL